MSLLQRKNYSDCCEPFHKGSVPETAEQLMRSRYSGYAKRLGDYIIKTTHPKNSSFQRDTKKWKKVILQFCDETTFRKLEIMDFSDGENTATVTFKAYLAKQGSDFAFTEKSTFEKFKGVWTYLKGEFL